MSEQYSRPATIEDLKLLARSLNEGKLEGLLLTKRTVRDKDKADIIVIEKALGKRGA